MGWPAGYREWLPTAGLRDSVACYWASVTPLRHGPAVASVLPDGCADLIWQSGRGRLAGLPPAALVKTLRPAGSPVQPDLV
jgi:hypothetical protein